MTQQSTDTGARSRTRHAIITAALAAWSADAGASLGDVAEAAGVGRTTLHRYFPERSDLLEAATRECTQRLTEADERARIGDGTGREAVLRVCREYFDLGDVLALLFHGVVQLDGETVAGGVVVDDACGAALRRGQHDGSIDAGQPVSWLVSMLWCALYAGWSWVQDTGTSRHDALDLVLRSLDGVLRPRD